MTFYVYILKIHVSKCGGKWRSGSGPKSRSRCGLYGTESYLKEDK